MDVKAGMVSRLWSRFLVNQWRIMLVSFPAVFATGYLVWYLNKRRNCQNSLSGERQQEDSVPLPAGNDANDEATDQEQPVMPAAANTVSMATNTNNSMGTSFVDSGYQEPSSLDQPKPSNGDYPSSLPPTPSSVPVGGVSSLIDTTVIRGGRARATVQLPIDIIGRFIGRTGKNIKSLMAESGAQIHVQQKNLSKDATVVPCILQGTQSQINKAVDLICLRHPEVSLPTPQVYVPPLTIYSSSSASVGGFATSWDFTLKQSLVPSSSFLAIVTYIEKLNRLWLVPYSSTQSLEELHQNMSGLYKAGTTTSITNDTIDRDSEDGLIGKFCAVRVNEVYWLRGKVMGRNGETSDYEVRLMDYGSSVIVPLSSLRQLRKDHTHLPMQSLTYLLSNIRPIDSDSEDGMLVLQALVEGTVLEAHPTGGVSVDDDTPYVELYTQSQHGSEQTFINRELVNQGFAVWQEVTATANHVSLSPITTGEGEAPTTDSLITASVTNATTITTDTTSSSQAMLSNGDTTSDIMNTRDPNNEMPLVPRSVTLSDLLCAKPMTSSSGLNKGHDQLLHVTSTPILPPVDPMKMLFGDHISGHAVTSS